jgi:putative membrane protein
MMGGFGMGFMGLFWVAIIVVIAVLLWPYLKQGKEGGDSKYTPLDTLKQRYARGEIGRDEFNERRSHLME